MIRAATLLALIVWGGVARAAHAQAKIVVRLVDAGPGTGPATLARALDGPHQAIAPATAPATIRRDSSYDRTVIVLGRDAIVEGSVGGDVIVVGGDLYMHPGGRISQRAIAIGGGVYQSALATIGAGAIAYRDFSYDIVQADGAYELRYRELVPRDSSVLTLPGVYGFAVHTYDRSNGASLGFGPRITVPNGSLTLEPRLTYRSQLGAWDAGIAISDSLDRRTTISLVAGRGTFSNDAWIWSDLLNTAEFLFLGHDGRNYFRGARADVTIGRRHEATDWTFTPSLTLRLEETHSVRPDSAPTGGPFTFLGRHDKDDRLRGNPPVRAGRIMSIIGGARVDWEGQGTIATLRADVEAGRFRRTGSTSSTPLDPATRLDRDDDFVQGTIDGSVSFPTFGTQSLAVNAHAVITTRGPTPRQRFAYVGGSGTIPTLELLELGGDQLLYVDTRYSIPLEHVALPLVGPPTLVIRHAMGTAGIGGLPALDQATGLRLVVGVLYGEILIDPVTSRTHHTIGLSFAR